MSRSTGRPAVSATVVVVNGPIAAGKSTLSAALAAALGPRGRSVAVVDLDDVVDMTRFHDGESVEELWRRARLAHGALVAAFVAAGTDVVVAHGPFHDDDERRPLIDAIGPTPATWFTLLVSYDEAWRRVGLDPTRKFSRDPAFLRRTHERFHRLRSSMVGDDIELDAERFGVDELVEMALSRLV